MNKEIISGRQAINLMTLFLIGSVVVLGSGRQAKQDIWLAILISTIAFIPFSIIYAKLNTMFPDKDLYDIINITFGKAIGKVINLLFVWYFLHLGSLVIRNFTEFIQVVSMPETPQYVIALCMGVFCIWMTRSGLEVLSRWAAFFCPLVILMIISISILLIPSMEPRNLKPFLYNGLQPVLNGSLQLFTFPFAEAVVFTTVLSSLKNKGDVMKTYIISALICCTIFILIATRNIMVLGVEFNFSQYFSSYVATSTINILNFLQRMEIITALNFILAGIVKISICMYAASKGIVKIFNLKSYKPIAAPIGFLMINLSMIIYKNIIEMADWANNIYPFYALPFQVLIPLILFVAAAIRNKTKTEATM